MVFFQKLPCSAQTRATNATATSLSEKALKALKATRCCFFLKQKQVCTLVLEAAHNIGRGHSTVVLGESVVQLQHVLWWLLAGSEGPGLGPQLCEVHCGQKMAQKVLRIQQRVITRHPPAWRPVMVLRRPDGTAQAQARPRQEQEVQRADAARVGED